MDLSKKTCDNSELWNCRNVNLSLNRPHKTFSLIFWSLASFTWWRRHRWWSWRWSSPSRCWPHIQDAYQSRPESWWTCRSWWSRDRWWRCRVRRLQTQSLHQWEVPSSIYQQLHLLHPTAGKMCEGVTVKQISGISLQYLGGIELPIFSLGYSWKLLVW